MRLPLLFDCGADRGDLGRRRAAATADDPRAQVTRVRGELGEVLGRRVREDDAAAGEAGQTDVGQRGKGALVPPHLLERGERREEAGSVVRPHCGHIELRQALSRFRRRDSGERFRVLVEGQQRNDRQARHAPHRLDRVNELLEVVERLRHEEVGSAPLEHTGLLREELPADPRGRGLADRAHRPGDEHIAACDLACLAGELDPGRVDTLQLVLEEVTGQLAPVGAEGVRLDQLRAGVDKADVERDDGLGRPQVRLLRAAQPGHGG